ncbi:hypothetical protein ACHAXR_011164 [Thalassiosira sp. AJA248-18]
MKDNQQPSPDDKMPPKQKPPSLKSKGPASKLVILLLSLGLYIIVTTGVLARLFVDPNIISSASQLVMDLPVLHSEISTANATTANLEFICDAQNSDDFLPDGDIIKRALHSVIIGAMKGGTQALHKILTSGHPRILTSGKGHGELHFFNNRGLMRNLPEGSSARKSAFSRTIPRQDIRDGFEYILKDREALNSRRNGTFDITNDQNINKVGIHSAPIYLFSGRSVPARLLCVAPWVKILAILRNPIERAFSQYNFIRTWRDGVRPSFETFILEDIALLKMTGVIRDWNHNNFESFSGSDEEFQSWEHYIRRAQNKGPVGRGLYSIQLEMWIEEFNKMNKSVVNDMLVLQSEETKDNPKDAYEKAVQFLGLKPPRKTRHSVIEKDHHKTTYTHDGISNETYNRLYELFAPYNKRLYRLLGEDVWGGVWDDV